MDVKEAILTARRFIRDTYQPELITDIAFDEFQVNEENGGWLVIMSFTKPPPAPKSAPHEGLEDIPPVSRISKVLEISDEGIIVSMKNYAKSEEAN